MSTDKPTQAGPSKDTQAKTRPLPDEKVVESQHTLTMNDTTIEYTATTGLMHLRNADDDKAAAMFYVAYVRTDIEAQTNRPLTFCFNGGPGSSSVWLHLGAYGPRRIDIPDGVTPKPNLARLVDNEATLLDVTDLVFIDPVGTGFSRTGDAGQPTDFYQLEGDADSVCQFIERYLSKHHRWASPKFLSGESYGTTRAGAMAHKLQEKGIVLNGLILVSLAVNFQTFIFDLGNDLPYLMFLPTYAAVAWHHGMLDNDVAPDLDTLLAEVRAWTFDVYAPALLRGAQLPATTRREVATQLARYTGLDADDIDALNIRIADMRFSKTVLNRTGYTVGRMDGRYTGRDVDTDHRRTQRDPSIDAPMGPYTGLVNDYLRRTLNFDHDSTYAIINMDANRKWTWTREAKLGYPDTSDDLRRAMIANPHLQVLFANGIYDLATPFFGAEYTADHLDIGQALRQNIQLTYYPAGHMMYFHRESHRQLKLDIVALMARALS
ncbi:MAG: peptidase S10 [Myxococcota bacterium]|nr:peptidase S10 [Myxococcota bacterium]